MKSSFIKGIEDNWCCQDKCFYIHDKKLISLILNFNNNSDYQKIKKILDRNSCNYMSDNFDIYVYYNFPSFRDQIKNLQKKYYSYDRDQYVSKIHQINRCIYKFEKEKELLLSQEMNESIACKIHFLDKRLLKLNNKKDYLITLVSFKNMIKSNL